MNVLLRIRHAPALPSHPTAKAAWLCLVVLTVRLAEAEVSAGPSQDSVVARIAASVPGTLRAGRPATIADVALRPGGVLKGRVVRAEEGALGEAVAGLPVALLRGGQTVARTTTDVHGRFAFAGLSGALHRVVVDTDNGPSWRFYRVWTSSGAPPHALRGVELPVGRALLRGQSPFPVIGFPQAAMVTAISTAATLPPIIYYSVKKDDYIPASP